MGIVRAEIELINGEDFLNAKRNVIGEKEIKKARAIAQVDCSFIMLAINEDIQRILQLPVMDKRQVQLPTGETIECDIVSPVELRFQNRETTCRAVVLPGNSRPLLGIVPIGGMDVLIDLARQKLVVNPYHPDMPQIRL